jgi:hypothetical protein
MPAPRTAAVVAAATVAIGTAVLLHQSWMAYHLLTGKSFRGLQVDPIEFIKNTTSAIISLAVAGVVLYREHRIDWARQEELRRQEPDIATRSVQVQNSPIKLNLCAAAA